MERHQLLSGPDHGDGDDGGGDATAVRRGVRAGGRGRRVRVTTEGNNKGHPPPKPSDKFAPPKRTPGRPTSCSDKEGGYRHAARVAGRRSG